MYREYIFTNRFSIYVFLTKLSINHFFKASVRDYCKPIKLWKHHKKLFEKVLWLILRH